MITNVIDEDTELVQHVSEIVKELVAHGFLTSTAKLDGSDIIIIASRLGEKDGPIMPLFLLPSPEVMLQLIDSKTGEHLFKMAGTN